MIIPYSSLNMKPELFFKHHFLDIFNRTVVQVEHVIVHIEAPSRSWHQLTPVEIEPK
jgi:hypothetical protein